MKAKLEERKKALEDNFKKLEEKRQKLIDQGRGIQRQISEIQAEQVRFQGSYREIMDLLKEDEKVIDVEPVKEEKK